MHASRRIAAELARSGTDLSSSAITVLRRMVCGRHPGPAIRADGAVSTLLGKRRHQVGDVLASFDGPAYYRQRIQPMHELLMESAGPLLA